MSRREFDDQNRQIPFAKQTLTSELPTTEVGKRPPRPRRKTHKWNGHGKNGCKATRKPGNGV